MIEQESFREVSKQLDFIYRCLLVGRFGCRLLTDLLGLSFHEYSTFNLSIKSIA